MSDPLRHYRQVWLADFDFHSPPGNRPDPICMVAKESLGGATLRVWADELARMARPPFPTGADSLFVAYYASAEFGCFLSLGWPMPARVLDLFTEFRCLTNGLPVPADNSLLGALAYFGLGSIEAAEKKDMQDLAIRGGPYTDTERAALLAYCETDVVALAKLLPAMLPRVDLPRALFRGRYMAAAARMEYVGTPIDTETLNALREQWSSVKGRLIQEVDRDYGVYVPTGRRVNIRTPSGQQIFDEAKDWGLNPERLADVAAGIAAERRLAQQEFGQAIRAARKATGLTRAAINRWENAGKDHSAWPGLDVKGRELAGQYPQLGIGRGFTTGDGYDDTDYGEQLWTLLRDTDERLPRRHDDAVLREAAERLDGSREDDFSGPLSFSAARFAEWLVANDIPWPRTDTGRLSLSDDSFRQMAKQYPQVVPLRELRHSLSELRIESLAVGSDGRNRCLLSAFRSITGRNQPSNAKFIFGPSCWLRGLIKPEPGRAVAYVDWSQQEFGIAAALSGDRAMQEAYRSGDPYLAFAKQADAVPRNATGQSHPSAREQFKTCALAVQYGMGSQSLAQSLGEPEAAARELIRLHRQTYPAYWGWSQAELEEAMLLGRLHTDFGWTVHVGQKVNPRSLANFPMQANGAEMLRLACCVATERRIRVCAPIHDALLVEGSDDEVETAVANTQAAMAEASRTVLDGFELRTDAKIVRWPDRYMDPRGQLMWDTVMGILADLEVPF